MEKPIIKYIKNWDDYSEWCKSLCIEPSKERYETLLHEYHEKAKAYYQTHEEEGIKMAEMYGDNFIEAPELFLNIPVIDMDSTWPIY